MANFAAQQMVRAAATAGAAAVAATAIALATLPAAVLPACGECEGRACRGGRIGWDHQPGAAIIEPRIGDIVQWEIELDGDAYQFECRMTPPDYPMVPNLNDVGLECIAGDVVAVHRDPGIIRARVREASGRFAASEWTEFVVPDEATQSCRCNVFTMIVPVVPGNSPLSEDLGASSSNELSDLDAGSRQGDL